MTYSQLLTMQQSVIKIYISQVTGAWVEEKGSFDKAGRWASEHRLHVVASGWVN